MPAAGSLPHFVPDGSRSDAARPMLPRSREPCGAGSGRKGAAGVARAFGAGSLGGRREAVPRQGAPRRCAEGAWRPVTGGPQDENRVGEGVCGSCRLPNERAPSKGGSVSSREAYQALQVAGRYFASTLVVAVPLTVAPEGVAALPQTQTMSPFAVVAAFSASFGLAASVALACGPL